MTSFTLRFVALRSSLVLLKLIMMRGSSIIRRVLVMVVMTYFSIVVERPGIVRPTSTITIPMVMMAIVSTTITWLELIVVMMV